ncbi:MAG: hydrogenase maturation protease [Bacteroidetes bacterium]|nr:hydrogenase maturation protease [Bacteroidota bacterium]
MTLTLDFLINKTDQKILFVGIGNVLKSDDGVGVFISNRIKEKSTIQKLTVEVSIENYIGKINAINPDVLILIDCVDFGKKPGYYNLIPANELKDYTLNTHNISLKRISELFKMPVYILGIQPKSIDFGEELSETVLNAVHEILEITNH